MANEIQLEYRSGATLTYGAYEPDGSVRTAAGTSLPEISSTGYYTATDGSIVAGDAVVVKEGANVVAGGTYQPEVTVVNVSDVQSGLATEAKQDTMINLEERDEVADFPNGTVTYFKKGTAIQIGKKDLKDPDGNAVNSTEDVIGESREA